LKRVLEIVRVRVTATEADPVDPDKPQTGFVEYPVPLPAPAPDAEFLDYSQLDADTVMGWVKGVLQVDGRVEAWEAEARAALAANIEQAAAEIENPAFPWDGKK
jgi:hypothetical protein